MNQDWALKDTKIDGNLKQTFQVVGCTGYYNAGTWTAICVDGQTGQLLEVGRARGGDMVRGGVRRWKITVGAILSIHAPFSLPNHTEMNFFNGCRC